MKPLLPILLLLCGCTSLPTERKAPEVSYLFNMGNSMLPTFKDRELFQVIHCDYRDLKPGDTVVFLHHGSKIHHTLVRRADNGLWITKGDNNRNVDTGYMSATTFRGRTTKLKL